MKKFQTLLLTFLFASAFVLLSSAQAVEPQALVLSVGSGKDYSTVKEAFVALEQMTENDLSSVSSIKIKIYGDVSYSDTAEPLIFGTSTEKRIKKNNALIPITISGDSDAILRIGGSSTVHCDVVNSVTMKDLQLDTTATYCYLSAAGGNLTLDTVRINA